MNSDKAQSNPSENPQEYKIPDHWHDEEETNISSTNPNTDLEQPLEIQSATIIDEDEETSSPPVTELDEPLQTATVIDESEETYSPSVTELDEPLQTATVIDESEEVEFNNQSQETTPEKSLESIFSPEMAETTATDSPPLTREISQLQQQKQGLEAEIKSLKAQKAQIIASQMAEVQETLAQMVKEGLKELEQRKQSLEIAIEQLERRRARIREEMRTTFAGVSQDLAIRIQGFKEYLVGSLQDLAAAAEQIELPNYEDWKPPEPEKEISRESEAVVAATSTQFASQGFQSQARRIRELLDQYRNRPDYYGPPWQLRRTFEPIHAERVQNWFFSQGGRGAIRSMGSRLQNILVASAIASVLYSLHGDRCRVLVLANTPERLGEWRRGLQDCLGISRSDFGPNRGVVLFESPEALVQKADRLVEEKQLPFVILDETEDRVNLSLLQFPLWLAFAPEPQQMSSYLY